MNNKKSLYECVQKFCTNYHKSLSSINIVHQALKISCYVLGQHETYCLSEWRQKNLQPEVAKRIDKLLYEIIILQKPWARITGYRKWCHHKIFLNPWTLDPRPETEELVHKIQKICHKNAPKTILDLGTGSGCILISLLHRFPHSYGIGTDKEPRALKAAQFNARSVLGRTNNRSIFLQGDWWKALKRKSEKKYTSFDLIVSNPPYIAQDENIAKNVHTFDPHTALFSGNKGYDDYTHIIKGLPNFLQPNGYFFGEIDPSLQSHIQGLCAQHHLKCSFSYDSYNLLRFVCIQKKSHNIIINTKK